MIGIEATLVPPVDHRLARTTETIDAGAAGKARKQRDAKEKGRTLERGPSECKRDLCQKRMPMLADRAVFF